MHHIHLVQYHINDYLQMMNVCHNTMIKPSKLQDKPAGFEKVVAAAIISDGNNYTYCMSGTRNGLYYNSIGTQKQILLIDEMADGIRRQNDYLFVLCQGPILYNISLTINGNITTKFIEEEYPGGFSMEHIKISENDYNYLLCTAAKIYTLIRNDLNNINT
eukprot:116932_1